MKPVSSQTSSRLVWIAFARREVQDVEERIGPQVLGEAQEAEGDLEREEHQGGERSSRRRRAGIGRSRRTPGPASGASTGRRRGRRPAWVEQVARSWAGISETPARSRSARRTPRRRSARASTRAGSPRPPSRGRAVVAGLRDARAARRATPASDGPTSVTPSRSEWQLAQAPVAVEDRLPALAGSAGRGAALDARQAARGDPRHQDGSRRPAVGVDPADPAEEVEHVGDLLLREPEGGHQPAVALLRVEARRIGEEARRGSPCRAARRSA